jgi:integrase
MTYRLFKEVCGDLPVQQYQQEHLTTFYDLLSRLPALWSKSPQWRGKSLEQIAASAQGGGHKLLTMKTLARHFSALSGFFGHLKSRGEYIGDNPAQGRDFPVNRKLNEARDMWVSDELSLLLSSPVWSGCYSKHRRSLAGNVIIEDARYWLPLLGLYHGNRLEEFAQLRREEVQMEDGIWFFNITDKGDRQVKNAAAVRRVPLHPRVESLGFLDYVERVSKKAGDRLFPKLVAGGADGKYGHGFSKWFTRYRTAIGVYRKGLDYHSFRGGVETKLQLAGVPENQIDELLGHAGGGIGRRVYKKSPLHLKMLKEALSRVEWPEDKITHPRQQD